MARQVGTPWCIAIVLLLPIFSGGAAAAVNRTLDYGLNLELNSDQDDRAFSDLRLTISDDFASSRYDGQYSLTSSLFFNHREGDSNDQHQGRYDSQLHMLRSSAWWNFNAGVEVLPVASATDISEFSSQTVTTLETGPTLSLGRNMRGSLVLSALASELRYTETPLDSSRTDLTAAWSYPLDTNTEFGVETRLQSVEYLDDINTGRDFDQTSLVLSFATQTRDLQFRTSLSATQVDSAIETRNISGAEIEVSYQLNSLSSVVATASDSLQTSEAFNLLPGNLDEAQLEAGLLRNQRVSLGYRYNYQFFSLSADIFTNDVENVVIEDSTRNRIDGVNLQVTDQIFENYRYTAAYQRVENRIANTEREEIDLSLSYILFHTRSTSSQFGVFVELEDSNGATSENAGLRYLLNSRIF